MTVRTLYVEIRALKKSSVHKSNGTDDSGPNNSGCTPVSVALLLLALKHHKLNQNSEFSKEIIAITGCKTE